MFYVKGLSALKQQLVECRCAINEKLIYLDYEISKCAFNLLEIESKSSQLNCAVDHPDI